VPKLRCNSHTCPTRYFKNFSSLKGGKERNYIGGLGREGEDEERDPRKE
jgi:hypothetical protein